MVSSSRAEPCQSAECPISRRSHVSAGQTCANDRSMLPSIQLRVTTLAMERFRTDFMMNSRGPTVFQPVARAAATTSTAASRTADPFSNVQTFPECDVAVQSAFAHVFKAVDDGAECETGYTARPGPRRNFSREQASRNAQLRRWRQDLLQDAQKCPRPVGEIAAETARWLKSLLVCAPQLDTKLVWRDEGFCGGPSSADSRRAQLKYHESIFHWLADSMPESARQATGAVTQCEASSSFAQDRRSPMHVQ